MSVVHFALPCNPGNPNLKYCTFASTGLWDILEPHWFTVGEMPAFITPEEAFANYEDDSIGESVTVTRDDDDNNTTGVLQWFGGCVVRIKQIFGRNPKNRFVYPNGWTTNKSKMSQCKEDDLNWSLTNEQQFNDHSLSKDPCVNISIFLLLMAVMTVLAGNMLPRW